MLKRGWLAVWLTAMIVVTMPGALVGAQYDEGLPQGLLEITIDNQPIDASTTPRIEKPNPRIAGRLIEGVSSVEVGLGNGEIVRFDLEVNPRSGRFKGRAPDPLSPGTYSLYLNDVLVGDFIIIGDEDDEPEADGTPRARSNEPLLDLARVVPFPRDIADTNPNLAVLDGRYYSLQQEARRAAADAGDASRESVKATQDALAAAGWQQRYESRLASPQEGDSEQFELQVSTFVYQYDTADNAQTAFAAAIDGADATDESVAVGEASQVTNVDGVTPDTGAAYRAVRLIFREDRLLVVMVVADLLNREVGTEAVQALGGAVQQRAAAVLAGDDGGPGIEPVRLDVDAADESAIFESYGLLSGEVVPFYTENAETRSAREASYAGATDGFSASFDATVSGNERQRRNATPEATPPAGGNVAYDISIFGFSSDDEATAWLQGLGDRLSEAQLPGYLAFSPVTDGESYGDSSVIYEVQLRSGGEAATGYRVYVLVGSEVASVELSAPTELSLEVIDGIVTSQVRCLKAGSCGNSIALSDLDGRPERDAEE